jgi:phenylalanine-4-hydroxylase
MIADVGTSPLTSEIHELPADHPGFTDVAYRARRAEIARVAADLAPGQSPPDVHYTAEEDEVWALVSSELAEQHRRHAGADYLTTTAALGLPSHRVPQLREVDAAVRARTGFAVRPVPGLVPARDFYASLGRRTFLSTQYVRHHSVPFYTPEPDIIHEIIGHAPGVGSPRLTELYEAAGRASARTVGEDAHEFLSKVFWFSLEFGLVEEDGELRAYGAGLLSSFGELQEYQSATVRPWDLVAMGTTQYDITTYQPILFSAPDFDFMTRELGAFFNDYGDHWYEENVAR